MSDGRRSSAAALEEAVALEPAASVEPAGLVSRARRGSAAAADKASRIQAILDALYPMPPIPLEHADPFTLLVAVVLSAQTTDKKVNQVTPALFAAAPTPEAMARLSVAEIAAFIREVGLAPQKAKALKGLAERLVSEHGSRVPDTFEALVELPGVGRKTANVVLSQAFGQPAFPVDTHIHRLAARWGLSRGRSPDHTERDLRSIFPETSWNRLHLQIIYFGREHCPALRHDLGACPICSWAATKKRIAAERQGRAKPTQAVPTQARAKAAKRETTTFDSTGTAPGKTTTAKASTRTAPSGKAPTGKAAAVKASPGKAPVHESPAHESPARKGAAGKAPTRRPRRRPG